MDVVGIPPRTIDRRLASGRLVRLHASVYAVGHTALPELGPAMAAVLATSRWDREARVPREADPAMPVQPEMQGWVRLSRRERFRVDALFRDLRVAIELDSRWHDPAGPRMRDEARDLIDRASRRTAA